MKNVVKWSLLSAIIYANAFSAVVSDAFIGYSFDIPENWVRDVRSVTHHAFYDTTATYCSYINIVMSDYSNDTVYKTSGSWTEAHFIANLITTKSSVNQSGIPLCDPFGVVVYSDSSTSKQNENKAMELYTNYYSLDTTVGSWSEFVRYTSIDKKGYELYTIGDTADMKKNIDLYVTLTDYILLNASPTATFIPVKIPGSVSMTQSSSRIYGTLDLLGRNSGYNALTPKSATGIRIDNSKKALLLNR